MDAQFELIHKVPTLEEALNHAKGKIMLNLDKADKYFEDVYKLMKKRVPLNKL